MNKGEADVDCAAREAWEETGLDLAGRINPNVFLEAVFNQTKVKLFIVTDVPEDFDFQAQTRGEISVRSSPLLRSHIPCRKSNGMPSKICQRLSVARPKVQRNVAASIPFCRLLRNSGPGSRRHAKPMLGAIRVQRHLSRRPNLSIVPLNRRLICIVSLHCTAACLTAMCLNPQ